VTDAVRSEQFLNLYRAALGQSARDGELMLRDVLQGAQRSLLDASDQASGPFERDQLRLSAKFLNDKAAFLCAQFPDLLRRAFQNKQTVSSQFGELALGELNHDQLERMDETQVQERVEMARVLRFVQLTVQTPLNELNGYISALLGFTHVMPERNPLRPQIYLTVFQETLVQAAVPAHMRITWAKHMSKSFGEALRSSYALLAQKIKSYGVVPVPMPKTVQTERRGLGARVAQTTAPEASAELPSQRSDVVTLDRLRELLAGQVSRAQNVAPDEAVTQFSGSLDLKPRGAIPAAVQEAPEHATDFANTVPAAFEALQNMNQADDVIARLSQRPVTLVDLDDKAETARQIFRKNCQNPSQLLSLEVMIQMVDNLVNDTRLLEPIRRVIENLEPALLRLVMVDVRFFNNKQHPARRLLQEITQRGLAFGSVDTPEFALFIRSLHRHVNPLARMQIDSADPFDLALYNLNNMWSEQLAHSKQTVQQAVQALRRAEDRNLLAEKMVAALELIPDMQRVPVQVVDFLCGPWAQVMAYAELNNTEGVEDPGGYKNLVNLLLWSAQPELTRNDVAKLTKLVSKLLSKLREGLGLIDYPSLKTSLFFDVLMKLHQQAFRPVTGETIRQSINPRDNLLGNHKHWLAPAEAKASGFMDMADETTSQPAAMASNSLSVPMLDAVVPEASRDRDHVDVDQLDHLSVSAWVEIVVKGTWQRSQLSWISPQNSMYLFTSVHGQTQSMTRASLEKMLTAGTLRVVSKQSMVDGALDQVVQTAMLNSLETRR